MNHNLFKLELKNSKKVPKKLLFTDDDDLVVEILILAFF